MNKEQAHKMIREAFETPFDKNCFIIFVKNLLNSIDESKAFHAREYVKDEFKDRIRTYERIGTYSDSDGKQIDILIVYSPDHARHTQRNFAGRYLKDREKDAGLFAFASPDAADWRFSLVRTDCKFAPARQYSFLAGKNENSRTAQNRLGPILKNDKENPALKDLEDAFDTGAVAKEFFLKYRDLFLRTKEELDRLAQKYPADTVNFAKKLLGQIVFLYFLQKKGWFGVRRDADWGTGSKYFLRELFEKKHGGYKNFFNDMLEPLFYEALRADRSSENDFYSRFDCRIPFLNGGLFDPPGGYDWKHTDILLPDDLFSNTRRTKAGDTGDGILDVFDRYNFTVREDEPLEKEAAIDPELLGKAYEKFNAIRPDNFDEFTTALKSGRRSEENKFNKKFGVYYTPREIVHYMCRQSLTDYLAAELEGKAAKTDIENLLQPRTPFHRLPESIRKNAGLIDQKLADITVCDPAVGSGAFPVGMMNEIVRARNALSVFIKDPGRNDYEFKRRCIEHSLYGADIDPGAAEIAKLRLWLSLVVDEENVKEIKPLPNLDYKIVCGNSLLGVKEDLFNNDLFIRLEDLKRRFFNETDSEKKAAYKNQIDGLISDITKGHTRFDFEVWFSEVFHKKGGFDVVIGNPPYVLLQHTNRDANLLTYVKNKYTVASYKIDLYHLFIEKGVLMLKKDGCITYITPSNFSANNYAVKLRRFLLTRTSLKTILFFENNVFGASVNNLVFVATNSDAEYIQFQSATIADSALSVKQKAKIRQSDLINEKCLLIVPKNSRSSNILKKIERNKIKLGNLASVNFGMQLRDRNKFKDDVIENPTAQSQLNKYHRPCYTGKDIHKYIVLFNNRHCFFNKTAKRGGCWNEAIHNKKEKILIRQVGTFPEGGIDDKGYAVLNTAFMIAPLSNRINSKFLLAIINSNLIKFYWKNTYRDDRNVFPKIKGEYLKLIPIPEISEMCQLPVVKLIDQILAAKKQRPGADTSQLEKQIDQLVYKLYELTPEEINIAEGETG